MQDERAIQTIHFSATHATTRECYAVVTLDNGELGITRDGQHIPGLEWPRSQMDHCAASFARLTRTYRNTRPVEPIVERQRGETVLAR